MTLTDCWSAFEEINIRYKIFDSSKFATDDWPVDDSFLFVWMEYLTYTTYTVNHEFLSQFNNVFDTPTLFSSNRYIHAARSPTRFVYVFGFSFISSHDIKLLKCTTRRLRYTTDNGVLILYPMHTYITLHRTCIQYIPLYYIYNITFINYFNSCSL